MFDTSWKASMLKKLRKEKREENWDKLILGKALWGEVESGRVKTEGG